MAKITVRSVDPETPIRNIDIILEGKGSDSWTAEFQPNIDGVEGNCRLTISLEENDGT